MDEKERVEYLFKLLKPILKKSHNIDWSTHRYEIGPFGTKTDEGLKGVIMLVMYSKEDLPKLD